MVLGVCYNDYCNNTTSWRKNLTVKGKFYRKIYYKYCYTCDKLISEKHIAIQKKYQQKLEKKQREQEEKMLSEEKHIADNCLVCNIDIKKYDRVLSCNSIYTHEDI